MHCYSACVYCTAFSHINVFQFSHSRLCAAIVHVSIVQHSLISTCFSFHILDFVCSCSDSVIYTVPTRQIQIIFSILLFAGFIPKSTQDNCSCISNKACALCSTLIWDVLFQWRLAEVKRETVSRMEKAWPFNCCCSRQSVASPSLCLCQGSCWTFWAHFVVFSWFSVLS